MNTPPDAIKTTLLDVSTKSGEVQWPAGVTWSASEGTVSDRDLKLVDTVSALRFSRRDSRELTRIDITKLVTRWQTGSVTNRGLVIESLHANSSALAVDASTELPTGAKAVVEVWYTNKPKKE